MGWYRPSDWQAVAPGHQKQPLVDGRRAVVAGAQLAVFDGVSNEIDGKFYGKFDGNSATYGKNIYT